MTTVIRSETAFVSPPGNLPLFTPRLNGFSKRNLVSLHRMANSNPQTSSVDDVTGQSSLPTLSGSGGTAGTVVALSGGGVRVQHLAQYPVKSTIPIANPWSFGMCARLNSGASGFQALLATINYATNGLTCYTTQTPTTGATLVSLTPRPSANGAPGTAQSCGTASVFKFDTTFVIFLIHTGAGACGVEIWQSGNLVATGTLNFDTTTIQGSTGNLVPNQLFCAGSINVTFPQTDINLEAMAVWNKALVSDEKAANYGAFAALATTRGRAIP